MMIVVLIDSGLEAFSDAGKSPSICLFLDAVTPISGLVTGLLAGLIWWTSDRQFNLSIDVLVTLSACLAAIAVTVGALAVTQQLTFLNMHRPVPWYRYVISIAIFGALGSVVKANLKRKKSAEPQR